MPPAKSVSARSVRRRIAMISGVVGLAVLLAAFARDVLVEKRVAIVEPGRIVRGAWQSPWPLRRILARERIRTVVTLTAINLDDPKYLAQEPALRTEGVDWVIIPMRGSTSTLEQMAEAADILADPDRQPIFFHCVGGHHRSNLVHAAYRIRHQGWSAERAWAEVAALPWTRPESDEEDRLLIAAFAGRYGTTLRKDSRDERTTHSVVPAMPRGDNPDARGFRRDSMDRG